MEESKTKASIESVLVMVNPVPGRRKIHGEVNCTDRFVLKLAVV
jgi:hypothetical protein